MQLNMNTIFDYDTHAKNFINYLEVIIFKDGHIEYAVPSHQMKLSDIYCKNHNISFDQLINLIPITESPEEWICYNEGLISVWYEFILRPENISEKQKEALDKLVEKGCIYPKYESKIIYKNKYGNIISRKE